MGNKNVICGYIICLLLFLFAGCAGQQIVEDDSASREKGLQIVKTARSMLGKPYCWGGESPSCGFDCSGYVCWVYNQHGYNLPRTAEEQASCGSSISRSNLRAGDIVVFRPSWFSKHTGIYTGDNSFLHSPKSGSYIKEEPLDAPHWQKYFVEGRRIIR